MSIGQGGVAGAEAASDRNAEELVAKNKALNEANERISLLEKNITDLQRLMEMQAEPAPAGGAATPASKAAGEKSAEAASKLPEVTTDAALANLPEKAAEEALAQPPEADAEADQEATKEAGPEQPDAAEIARLFDDAPINGTEETPAEPAAAENVETHDGSNTETGLSALLSRSWVLGALGGAGVLVLLVLALAFRRKSKVDIPENAFTTDDPVDKAKPAASFDESLVAASLAARADGADEAPADSSVNSVEDEEFDLDEVMTEPAAPAPIERAEVVEEVEPEPEPEPEPEQPYDDESEAELNPEPELEAVPEPEEFDLPQTGQGEPNLESGVELDFPEPDPSGVPVGHNPEAGILSDLDDMDKGATAAQEEMKALRDAGPDSAEDEASDYESDLEDDSVAEPDSGSSEIDDATWQEVATKLDLAGAYVEIGDAEGAKELLDEIVKKGDSEQVRKAKELLGNL
ncbi:MAG: hypothetical protein HC848_08325 [Limnobacter sp.]|nr:hypothetical protein [Limnobacter sp.]